MNRTDLQSEPVIDERPGAGDSIAVSRERPHLEIDVVSDVVDGEDVVVDDALQGISHVVRGLDLYEATSIHRLLQELLGLPAPLYHHHTLLLDADGRKLKVPGIVPKLSATPGTIRHRAPRLGEHTDEVLGQPGWPARD